MGVDYNVYIGPYVKIHNPKKNSFDEFQGCNTGNCVKRMKPSSSKFCDTCGKPIVLVKKPTKKSIDVDFYELTDEHLVPVLCHYYDVPPDYNFLVPNKKWCERTTHFDPRSFAGEIDFDHKDVLTELVKFESTFDKWLQIVKEKFGETNVVIKWGTIFYAS